jgi:hypothetical protein
MSVIIITLQVAKLMKEAAIGVKAGREDYKNNRGAQ